MLNFCSPIFSKDGTTLTHCFSPAKINLFLHIIGRRPDGYHQLQTAFQLIDWGDLLHFSRRDDGKIDRISDNKNIPASSDLIIKAAKYLQLETNCTLGVDISIEKNLPLGAGLGGGSSNAATTLLALNKLWSLNLSRAKLLELGLKLGADVPFFIFGHNAFAEGIGEKLTAIQLPKRYFLVVVPPIHVSTQEIFSLERLTRDTKIIKIADFLNTNHYQSFFGQNDMQCFVAEKYVEVAKVLNYLSILAPTRMSGSGASVFSLFADKKEALAVQNQLPSHWQSIVIKSINKHPLFSYAI